MAKKKIEVLEEENKLEIKKELDKIKLKKDVSFSVLGVTLKFKKDQIISDKENIERLLELNVEYEEV